MIKSLSNTQLGILRRCRNGLRVWEQGAELQAMLAELKALRDLGLVTHDETSGFELSAAGEQCLNRLDR